MKIGLYISASFLCFSWLTARAQDPIVLEGPFKLEISKSLQKVEVDGRRFVLARDQKPEDSHVQLKDNKLTLQRWDGTVTWIRLNSTDAYKRKPQKKFKDREDEKSKQLAKRTLSQDLEDDVQSFPVQKDAKPEDRFEVNLTAYMTQEYGKELPDVRNVALDYSAIAHVKPPPRKYYDAGNQGTDVVIESFIAGNFPPFDEEGFTWKAQDGAGKTYDVKVDYLAHIRLAFLNPDNLGEELLLNGLKGDRKTYNGMLNFDKIAKSGQNDDAAGKFFAYRLDLPGYVWSGKEQASLTGVGGGGVPAGAISSDPNYLGVNFTRHGYEKDEKKLLPKDVFFNLAFFNDSLKATLPPVVEDGNVVLMLARIRNGRDKRGLDTPDLLPGGQNHADKRFVIPLVYLQDPQNLVILTHLGNPLLIIALRGIPGN